MLISYESFLKEPNEGNIKHSSRIAWHSSLVENENIKDYSESVLDRRVQKKKISRYSE